MIRLELSALNALCLHSFEKGRCPRPGSLSCPQKRPFAWLSACWGRTQDGREGRQSGFWGTGFSSFVSMTKGQEEDPPTSAPWGEDGGEEKGEEEAGRPGPQLSLSLLPWGRVCSPHGWARGA